MAPRRKALGTDHETGKPADFRGRIPEEWWTRLSSEPQALSELDRLANLGYLTGNLAHDILNPLSAALNLCLLVQQMLSSKRLSQDRVEAMKKYLGDAASETARACRLVSEMRSFARAAGPKKELLDLNGIVEGALLLASRSPEFENVPIDRRFDPGSLWVSGDRSALQHLVIRILQAGAQTVAGNRIEVLTGFQGTAGGAFLEIRQSQQAPPGRRGSRSHRADKPARGGPLAGLSAARYICRMHGWDIRIQRTPPGATVCRIVFPPADSSGAKSAGRRR
jgi:signal transduction histidine kinase